jgi:hypothetical protein
MSVVLFLQQTRIISLNSMDQQPFLSGMRSFPSEVGTEVLKLI